jgi:hypothetical protein
MEKNEKKYKDAVKYKEKNKKKYEDAVEYKDTHEMEFEAVEKLNEKRGSLKASYAKYELIKEYEKMDKLTNLMEKYTVMSHYLRLALLEMAHLQIE